MCVIVVLGTLRSAWCEVPPCVLHAGGTSLENVLLAINTLVAKISRERLHTTAF